MLSRLDDLLLEKFEKFAHWWQKNISGEQDCFWWAKKILTFSIIYNILSITAIVLYENPPSKKLLEFTKIMAFPEIASTFLTPFLFYKIVKTNEEETKLAQQKGLANPFKYRDLVPRILSLILLLAVVSLKLPKFLQLAPRTPLYFLLGNAVYLLGFVFVMYLAACNPLPPAKSKIRKWLESLTKSLGMIFTPASQSIPIQSNPIRIPSE